MGTALKVADIAASRLLHMHVFPLQYRPAAGRFGLPLLYFVSRQEPRKCASVVRGLQPFHPSADVILFAFVQIMPPPRTTPSRHANADTAAQNQYTAPSLSANPATRILNPASGYASSSLAAKSSGLQFPKPAANPPSNLRLTGWEDRAAKAKLAAGGSASAGVSAPQSGKGGSGFASGGDISRARTPPPADAVESYEISPFKEESSDEEEEENESEAKKPIPAWARKENLGPALRRQMGIDPDEVFQNMSVKTCSLDQGEYFLTLHVGSLFLVTLCSKSALERVMWTFAPLFCPLFQTLGWLD